MFNWSKKNQKVTCYLFQNNTRFTSGIYNCSKYPLPRNFEVKLYFSSVDWIKTRISFSNENEQTDANYPSYDIYCILEDLMQFYTKILHGRSVLIKEEN